MFCGRHALLAGLFCAGLSAPATGQVYDVRELNAEQICALPLERTVVMMPGGILEEHGPYLPVYTDGYVNEYEARQVANAIVRRPGWIALMFPSVPLGAGGANQIGLKSIFPGTYHVHYETLRAVYMDLAAELGEAGFRWIFVFQGHGSMAHKLALDQASDFFVDRYGGRMVHLGGLTVPAIASRPPLLTSESRQENGLDVHGGFSETSSILFLRPDLASPASRTAEQMSGATWSELVEIGARNDWPGYFGSPRLASAESGAEIMRRRVEDLSHLVLRILDGLDPGTLPRDVDAQTQDDARVRYNRAAAEHDRRIRTTQQDWLAGKGRQYP